VFPVRYDLDSYTKSVHSALSISIGLRCGVLTESPLPSRTLGGNKKGIRTKQDLHLQFVFFYPEHKCVY
jgi:hypothetical protein